MKYKIIVAGGRKFNNYDLLKDKLDYYLKDKINQGYDIVIVSGTATGADSLGEKYAIEKGYKIERYPAEWDNYGLSAGYKRNVEMAKVANACVVFWNGTSKGSKHMIDIATNRNIPLRIVKY
jgi:hypothetical protein